MRKYIVPAVFGITVFCITYYFQTFTLLRQEGLGLFLNTPDFYRALFFDPLPISSLIGSFLVQFYSQHIVGVCIVTAMVLLAYLLVMSILKTFDIHLEVIGAVGACTAWWFIAHAAYPTLGVAILLGLSVIFIAAAIRKHLSVRPDLQRRNAAGWWSVAAVAAIIAATAVLIAKDTKISEVEKWSKVEFAAVQGDWDYLLKQASPDAAQKDPALTPYALMALNAQGKLSASEMSKYPLTEDFGLDYGDELSYRSCLFNAVLYSRLGCPNEAIHKTHQSGDYLYHGTSFRTLRMLVKENYALHDSLMVVKYCDILDRSLTHKDFVSYFREHPCPQRVRSTTEERTKTPLTVSRNQMETMLQIGRAGINSGMVMERYYGYYQVKEYYDNH